MIEEITIKFDMELKPTQVSWKSQLYIPNGLVENKPRLPQGSYKDFNSFFLYFFFVS